MRNLVIEEINSQNYSVVDQGTGKKILDIGLYREELEKAPIFIDSNTIQLTFKDYGKGV